MLQTNEKEYNLEKEIHTPKKKENTLNNEPIKNHLNSCQINKMEDYTEVIPQKLETKQNSEKSLKNEKGKEKEENDNPDDNYDNQNLDFSFGKDFQKDNMSNKKNNNDINKDNNNSEKTDSNTNTCSLKYKFNKALNNEIFDKRDIFSENMSSYQMTDSLSNLKENNNLEEYKKLKIIKEKFISTFKNKERGESLEKALTLFEKYQNLRTSNLNSLSHSFTNFKDIPYKNLISQNINSLTIIDNKINNKNKKNEDDNNNTNKNGKLSKITSSFNNLKIEYLNKNNENFISSNCKTIEKQNNINIINNKSININNINNLNNNKLVLKKAVDRKKGEDNKIFSIKDCKKKGFLIRKVIREEKYYIDDNGKEKLIRIKQSTIDSKENNETKDPKQNNPKENKPFINLKYKNQNLTLLNKKKFAEFIKGKINNKKNSNSISMLNKNQNNLVKKNIEINTDNINNKYTIDDNSNNIKIVINKINKINTNPKINLNFIKKYKFKKLKDNTLPIKILNKNKTNICKTEANQNKKFHLIKIDKLNNGKIIEYKPILTNANYISNKNIRKQKANDSLTILKCEKIGKMNKTLEKQLISSKISKYSSNPRMCFQKNQNYNKRNYSFKEIKNLSNNIINSSKYILNKKYEKDNYRINTEKNLTADSFNNKYKIKNVLNQNTGIKKNKKNHTFYESKSFSSEKNLNQKLKNNDNNKKVYSINNRHSMLRIYKNKKDLNCQFDLLRKGNNTINCHNFYYYQNRLNQNFDSNYDDRKTIY